MGELANCGRGEHRAPGGLVQSPDHCIRSRRIDARTRMTGYQSPLEHGVCRAANPWQRLLWFAQQRMGDYNLAAAIWSLLQQGLKHLELGQVQVRHGPLPSLAGRPHDAIVSA